MKKKSKELVIQYILDNVMSNYSFYTDEIRIIAAKRMFNMNLHAKYGFILSYCASVTKKCKTYEELKKTIKSQYADLRVYMCIAAYLNHDAAYCKENINDFIKKFIPEILKHEPKYEKNERLEANKKMLKEYLDNNNNLTLYRGFHSTSVKLKYSMSWTLSKEHAKKFIYGDINGGLAIAKVNIKDVILYNSAYTFLIKEKECVLSPIKELKDLKIENAY